MSSKAEKEHRDEVRAHFRAIESRLGIKNPSPHPHESHTTENTPSAETNEQSNKTKNKVEGVLTSIQTYSQETHCHHCCAQKPKKHWYKSAKPWIGVFGFVVLVVYTAFTGAMYFANNTAAIAAKSAADTAHTALVESNRNWLEFNLDPAQLQIGPVAETDRFKKVLDRFKRFEFNLILKNVGKAPVKDIQMESGLVTVVPDQPIFSQYFVFNGTLAQNIMFPDQTAISPASKDFKDGRGAEISEIDRQDLLSGNKYLIAFARGTFSDGFGPHWIQYCNVILFSSRGGKWMGCVAYNDTGDGSPPWVNSVTTTGANK